MNRNQMIWIIATAMIGFSACNDEVTSNDCDDGSQKCEDNSILTCVDGVWKVEACEDKICNETTLRCEARLCTDGEKRCQDNAVERCQDNAWIQELDCGEDKICDDKSFSCFVPECETGWERCNENVVETCNNGRYEAASPAACAEGLVCLEDEKTHSTSCVGCAENADCPSKQCDLETHECIPPSTIEECHSEHMNGTTAMSYGYLIDPRSPKDSSTISAKVLCGQAGQKLSEYRELVGEYNTNYVADDGRFSYMTDLSVLGTDEHLCLWSFALEGEVSVACKAGEAGGTIHDLDSVPSQDDTFEYPFKFPND